jgi:hypothetical protein
MKYTKWTNKQMVRLRKYYPTMTKQELIIEFAPHSWGSIKMTAQRNRIRKRSKYKNWKAVCDAHVMQSGWFESTS